MSSKVISLDHIGKLIVGNKASRLAVLMKNGLPIPNGGIYSIHDTEDYQQLFTDCISLIKPPFIIRSSFALEDSNIISFAGIFESISNISTPADLKGSIQKVIASTTSKKLVAYADYYNINIENLQPIVLIQEYIKPVLSGVAFTQDPTNKNILLLEYSPKLEGVTAGTDRSCQVKIDKNTQKILSHTPSQILQNEEIVILVEHCLKIETIFKKPQDIEWMFDGDKIWIVQSRDITSVDHTKFINHELSRFRKEFNKPIPRFARKFFAEEIEYITPVTLDLFRKFYSKDGAFGNVMKKLFIPLNDFDENKYVTAFFSRPYINETLEKSLCSVDYTEPMGQALILSIKKIFTNPLSFFSIFVKLFRAIFVQVVLQVKLFIFYRNRGVRLEKLSREINQLENSKVARKNKIENHIKFLEKKLVPELFIVNLFQQHVYDYLKRNIQKHLREPEWNDFIKTNDQSNDNFSLNALELSAKRNINKIKTTRQTKSDREAVLKRFQDIWLVQIYSVYADIYDALSTYRTRLHNEFVKLFNTLHYELLGMDQELSLYNSIWYADINQILHHPEKLNPLKLYEKKKINEYLRKISIPNTIQVTNWKDVLEETSTIGTGEKITGEMLSSGTIVEGIVGTREMIDRNEPVDILLTNHIDPGIVIYYEKIKGVITVMGGELSHAAIVAREFGLPIIKIEQYPNQIVGKTIELNPVAKEILLIQP